MIQYAYVSTLAPRVFFHQKTQKSWSTLSILASSSVLLLSKDWKWWIAVVFVWQCPRSSRAARNSLRSTAWWTAFTACLELLQISRNCGKEAQTDRHPMLGTQHSKYFIQHVSLTHSHTRWCFLMITLWWMHQEQLRVQHLACRLEQPGIEPPTFRLVDDLLCQSWAHVTLWHCVILYGEKIDALLGKDLCKHYWKVEPFHGLSQHSHVSLFTAVCCFVLFSPIRHEFDSEQIPDLTKDVYIQDIHCVGSLCKLYFRELPNPLLTYQLYEKFSVSKTLMWATGLLTVADWPWLTADFSNLISIEKK